MTKNICIIGLGYIGLPTAVMFANSGVRVHGVDINEKAVNMIANKQLHIEENGLQERLEQAIDEELLHRFNTTRRSGRLHRRRPITHQPGQHGEPRIHPSSDSFHRPLLEKRRTRHSRIDRATENSRKRHVARTSQIKPDTRRRPIRLTLARTRHPRQDFRRTHQQRPHRRRHYAGIG